ncbi:acetylglutamate kinase [Petrotoga mobilis SJ95]|jgi:acetylglutamate kinase|uniref:Acetylglutamate kinase n=1 Tax=Petrotoga mobilis (strain DSM 10674 / SJ95) TaxID=403833 RepID=ARGB_PETMO|nr:MULTISPECIES: acetylglutamate kinase [Petrotoga]A9BI99.1 RecName: Full=Acetylglutamate kinase; AltName: Full=N-acetyl-L-glutamate 5-phosphotransferase; AltName: Full=NAG kinase; Short=NAGK [Petrotoga mobilis SJ95]ABX32390.1 acetylglutamate kinase [Petrotoga mobilis SJ95]MBL5981590.1 acetylglutamate kinase [Petrotoga sp. 8T1HF07.NaAc.6.1]PNR92181.1 acetylglutamate kinase [Petrotoga sp. HWHPT.55.6.3]RPD35843.1 acetylglutamate kinase [Petrotoga sp. HWH.PT.55.6.1]
MIKVEKFSDEISKAEVLVEALPYIKKFAGSIAVIKFGGNAMKDPQIKSMVAEDIVLMKYVGLNPVIVHGGGPDINKMLASLNIETKFVNGLRVTDEKVMEIVEMVLVGKINKEITSLINKTGGKAVGLSGKDANLLLAEKDLSQGDLGYVGKVVNVNREVILNLIEKDYIPVIAPCAIGRDWKTYNVNADIAAGKIASSLNADKFVLLTDVEGVLKNKEDEESVISRLSYREAKDLLNSQFITGGMIPKLKCCIQALEDGVKRAHIIDGRIPHALLLEIYTDKGVGTMIAKEVYDNDNL